jgi:hypothetical protein
MPRRRPTMTRDPHANFRSLRCSLRTAVIRSASRISGRRAFFSEPRCKPGHIFAHTCSHQLLCGGADHPSLRQRRRRVQPNPARFGDDLYLWGHVQATLPQFTALCRTFVVSRGSIPQSLLFAERCTCVYDLERPPLLTSACSLQRCRSSSPCAFLGVTEPSSDTAQPLVPGIFSATSLVAVSPRLGRRGSAGSRMFCIPPQPALSRDLRALRSPR